MNKLYKATEIAKELGLNSSQALNKKLEAIGVIERYEQGWRLTAKFEAYGLVDYSGYTRERSSGKVEETIQMKWTELGREYLIKYKDRVLGE